MLSKIVPLIILAGVSAKAYPMAKEQLNFVMNYTKITATKHEISNIKKLILVELASDGRLPGDWQDIVGSQLEAKDRDPLIDMWMNPYYVDYFEDEEFLVGSAGLDKEYDTNDDIIDHYGNRHGSDSGNFGDYDQEFDDTFGDY